MSFFCFIAISAKSQTLARGLAEQPQSGLVARFDSVT